MRILSIDRIAVIVAALSLPIVSRGQELSDSAEAAGLLNACFTQSLAIESYEVCIDAWETGLKPDDTDFEIRSVLLLSRDFSSERYRRLTHEQKREGDTRSTCVSALALGKNVNTWIACDGRRHVGRNGDTWTILRRNDVRLVGHMNFPWEEFVPGLGMSVTDKYTASRPCTLRHQGDVAVITQEETVNNQRFMTYWKIKSESSLPVEFRRSWYIKETERWKLVLSEEVTWDQSREIPVPVHVVGVKSVPGTTKSGEIESYDMDYQVTIHWDSLNQPIEPEVFESEIDASSILKAVEAAKRKHDIK